MSVFGVVIPSHGGGATLHRSMMSLARQRFDEVLRVVVAVNGDAGAVTTETVTEAERLASMLRADGISCTVIRTPAGRALALRTADRQLPSGPRLYLDQDAALSSRAVADLATALAPGTGVHFAVPGLRFAASPSRFTRAYFQAWCELPYVRLSPVTCGAYAVSAAGRERWPELPDVHSDDKWVRWHFAPKERMVVHASSYEVIAPDGVVELLRARLRYLRGNRELRRLPRVPPYADDHRRNERLVRTIATHPARLGPAAVMLTVHAAVALADRWPPPRSA